MRPTYGAFRRFRDRFRARRDGRRDGLLGIPTRDEVACPPALLQIKQRADEALSTLARGWVSDDARLEERATAARRGVGAAQVDVDNAAFAVAELEERHEADLEHRDTFAEAAPAASPGVRISPRIYAVAIVAILVAEFPLNAIAFRLFGEAEVLTWVMTASLAVTLVLCAHGLGTFLRVVNPTLPERRWIVVLVVLPVMAIVAIAIIRSRYLSLEAELTGLDVLGPFLGSLTFLVINLLVYAGATMLSYLAHAPRHAGEREAIEAAEGSGARLLAAQQRLTEATRQVRRHERELATADVGADEARRLVVARAAELASYHRQLMTAYCAANLRARGNPELPAVLRELPAIDMPAALRAAQTAEPELVGSRNGKASDDTLRALGGAPGSEAAR